MSNTKEQILSVKKEMSEIIKFQMKNKIERLCPVNTAYMLNWCGINGIKKVKLEGGLIEYNGGDSLETRYTEHIWFSIDGVIFEPSYQFTFTKSKYYTFEQAKKLKLYYESDDYVLGNINRLKEGAIETLQMFHFINDIEIYKKYCLHHKEKMERYNSLYNPIKMLEKMGVKAIGVEPFKPFTFIMK